MITIGSLLPCLIQIPETARTKPDTWVFVDKEGGEHRWRHNFEYYWTLPTLEERIMAVRMAGEDFDPEGVPHFITGWFVPATGERVKLHAGGDSLYYRYHWWAQVQIEADERPPQKISLADCRFAHPPEYSPEGLEPWTLLPHKLLRAEPGPFTSTGMLVFSPSFRGAPVKGL